MFGAEPYQFKPTYPPGEEPALHGEGEERSTSPEHVRVGNTDWCVSRKCISVISDQDECYRCQELDGSILVLKLFFVQKFSYLELYGK